MGLGSDRRVSPAQRALMEALAAGTVVTNRTGANISTLRRLLALHYIGKVEHGTHTEYVLTEAGRAELERL